MRTRTDNDIKADLHILCNTLPGRAVLTDILEACGINASMPATEAAVARYNFGMELLQRLCDAHWPAAQQMLSDLHNPYSEVPKQ